MVRGTKCFIASQCHFYNYTNPFKLIFNIFYMYILSINLPQYLHIIKTFCVHLIIYHYNLYNIGEMKTSGF